MFTGIVTDIGEIVDVERRGDTAFTIACGYAPETIAIGASIACAGVCLTVLEAKPHAGQPCRLHGGGFGRDPVEDDPRRLAQRNEGQSRTGAEGGR